ncbi:MAG TPA: hypothetical protein VGZ32_20400 [Actinocrinis sp.]|jgi:hypothetical protein|uniref:hypothetical protein n=1 Tax=Actinocrinis sp. TaxID=1920516 RepID=UPI002DDD04F3|nr:hypothetical protein [Actinocrinis sp.]HEV3172719.1 hypothetical protein [Actinocrinis sp.]
MTAADLTPAEIAAALAARRELGPEYEDAIAASLAERVEREIARRVDAAPVAPAQPARARQEPSGNDGRWIGVASLIAGIPVTGIVAGTSHGNVLAIAVAWGGIALVNMAHALGRRHG